MTKSGGQSTIITNPRYWMHIPTGWIWRESHIHREHIILKRVQPPGGSWGAVRIRPFDPIEGGLGAPYWIKVAKPQPIGGRS